MWNFDWEANKMKGSKKVLLLLLISVVSISLVSCGEIDTMARIEKDDKVIWGTNAEFAPFEMRDGEDVIGIDAEIAKKIAEKLGVELVVEDMKFDPLPAALKSGKIDFIAAGYSKDPDREREMTFSKSYFKAVQAIIVEESNDEIQGVKDLEGKKIGVQNGTTGDIISTEDIEGAYVHRYNNGLEAVLDLQNGNLDAVVIDVLPAQMLVAENDGVKILDERAGDEESYVIAVRKGDEELIEVINEVLDEMLQSGEIDELVNKYSIGE